MRGLILISLLFDFREFSGSSLLQYVASLPSFAAVARAAKGSVTPADMDDVERYARGDFLLDLIKGQTDAEATNRLADKGGGVDGDRSGRQAAGLPVLRCSGVSPRV